MHLKWYVLCTILGKAEEIVPEIVFSVLWLRSGTSANQGFFSANRALRKQETCPRSHGEHRLKRWPIPPPTHHTWHACTHTSVHTHTQALSLKSKATLGSIVLGEHIVLNSDLVHSPPNCEPLQTETVNTGFPEPLRGRSEIGTGSGAGQALGNC